MDLSIRRIKSSYGERFVILVDSVSFSSMYFLGYLGYAAVATGLGLTVKAQRKDYLPAV